jgi:glycerophosphoryl diester phosphodiesterase
MVIVAHRGSMAREPENSIASFRRAVDDGADLVETDLRLTSDGEFVCFHDATLERTTNGSGPVSGKSRAELARLALRLPGGSRNGEGIPSLEDLVDLLPTSVFLALELKDPRFADPALCANLAARLRALGVRERTLVLAASRKKARAMRGAASDIPIGYITFALAPPGAVEMLGPLWPILLANPLYVRWAHHRGIVVCPLDPKPDGRLALYRALKCDALLTDDPAATIAALRKIEARA